MTESVNVFPLPARQTVPSPPSRDSTEIAIRACGRCKSRYSAWDLRTFGDKVICPSCYEATVELGESAVKAMPAEPGRLCSNCRALRDPSLGSAWCPVLELGDERARICANFVSVQVEETRASMKDGRAIAITMWQRISGELESILGEDNYKAWFGEVDPVSYDENVLTLAVSDEKTREWLGERLSPVLHNAMVMAGFSDAAPAVVLDDSSDPPPEPELIEELQSKAGFNPHYTFREFIVGSGNRLAHASALACVDKPAKAYNPLVIYGGVGVGKTHLLQAIGQEAIDQRRGHVLYTTSETFTNDLIAAIRDGSTGAFRERYRSTDFLLIDDIQFIAGKEATQEEFFHTFNALHQSGKQIVLTSDRSPSELRVLQDRLRSRFAWGLTADMQAPDLETRIAIVRSKASIRQMQLHETVINALATRAGSNVRELEGAMNRVLALAELLGTEPSMDVVRTVLGDPDTSLSTCRPADILQAVSSYYRVKTSEIIGPQRDRDVAYARQMTMYLMREEAKLSLVEVGNQLGGRNHSTVIYGCEKIGKEVRRKGRVKQDVQAIKQLIYGTGQ